MPNESSDASFDDTRHRADSAETMLCLYGVAGASTRLPGLRQVPQGVDGIDGVNGTARVVAVISLITIWDDHAMHGNGWLTRMADSKCDCSREVRS